MTKNAITKSPISVDPLIESFKKAIASIPEIDWKDTPGYGSAYSGPGGRGRTKASFES